MYNVMVFRPMMAQYFPCKKNENIEEIELHEKQLVENENKLQRCLQLPI